MANYYGRWRSNRFKVKHFDLFVEEMEDIPNLELVQDGEFVLIHDSPHDDAGGLPNWRCPNEEDEDEEIVWSEIFALHLQKGSIAVLVEAGHEKLRYLIGHAVAFNHKGEHKTVNTDDIYKQAKEAWPDSDEITLAQY